MQGACALDVAIPPGAVGASRWRVALSDDGGADNLAAPAFFELRVLAPPPPPPPARTDLPGLVVGGELANWSNQGTALAGHKAAVVTVQMEPPPALPPPAVTAGVQGTGKLVKPAVSSEAAPSLAPVAPVGGSQPVLHRAGRALLEADPAADLTSAAEEPDAPGVVEGGVAGARGRKLLEAEALRFQMAVERPKL